MTGAQDPLTRLSLVLEEIGAALERLDALLLEAAREGDLGRVEELVAARGKYLALLEEAAALVEEMRSAQAQAAREYAEARRRLGHRVRALSWAFLLPRLAALLAAYLAPLLALLGRALRPKEEPAPLVKPVPLLIIPTTIQPTAAPNA